jgi:hypothetical protein
VTSRVAPLGLDAATQRAVLDRSAKLAERWTKLASLGLRERVRSLVQQSQIGEAQILVWLNRTAVVSSVMPNAPPKPTDSVEPFVLSITASLRRAGKGVRLVIGNGAAKAIDGGLASLIARAIATRNMFLAGRDVWKGRVNRDYRFYFHIVGIAWQTQIRAKKQSLNS